MERFPIYDAHYDIFQTQYDYKGQEVTDSYYSVDTNEMLKNTPLIRGLTSFVHPEYATEGFARANEILDRFYEDYAKNPTQINIIRKHSDLQRVLDSQGLGVVLGIENGSAIQGNLEAVRYFYERGVRVMGITWNPDNDLGCGVATKNDTGLTELGRAYIKEVRKHRMLIDLSHASQKTFYDVMSMINTHVIATHSGARSVCDHRRNLTDRQIKEIAKRGGIIGIPFYGPFLNPSGKATVTDIIEHIDYIANLVGISHVGLGTDFQLFEQKEMPEGISNLSDLNKLFEELHKYGYDREEIELIAGGNFINLLNRTLVKDRNNEFIPHDRSL